MRKLKLSLDNLAVESFQTDEAMEARGTVAGHDTHDSCPGTVGALSCRATAFYCCQPSRVETDCC